VIFASLAALAVPREGANGTTIFVIELVAMMAIFYFVLLRPQRVEQDKHRKMLAAVKRGDEVVTAGGIIGNVIHVEDERITIRTAESTRIVVERGKVARVLTAPTTKELQAQKEPDAAKNQKEPKG
jgi:preprotein translocase subunit YajC